MLCTDNIPPAKPPQNPDTNFGVLEKVEEKPADEIHLDADLKNLFPEADDVFEQVKEGNNEESVEDINFEFIKKLDKGKIPEQLDFLVGGKNSKFDQTAKSFNLSKENLQFLISLQSDACSSVLISNKIKIHT